MNHLKRAVPFLLLLLALVVGSLHTLEKSLNERIELGRETIVQQARDHYLNQVNTRKWNAQYGGLYARPLPGQKPNPYLVNNILKVDENLTLIRINPAWMTRQLSEQLDESGFHFRITSLNPINPNNVANKFEREALAFLEKGHATEYYKFNDDNARFDYMGVLKTTKACLQCHAQQGYKIGDTRGGISVTLHSDNLLNREDSLRSERNISKALIVLFALAVAIAYLLLLKRANRIEELNKEIASKGKEARKSRDLFQGLLDSHNSFVVVTHKQRAVFANIPLLNFLGFTNFDHFEKRDKHIEEFFDPTSFKEKDYLKPQMDDGSTWLEYLLANQENPNLKVLMRKGKISHIFRPYVKAIKHFNNTYYLVSFDDITQQVRETQQLESKAFTDPLTGLFNRRHFDQLIDGQFARANSSNPTTFSLLFLDIDLFKRVNDTYGHSTGDKVLVNIAKIIGHAIRKSDVAARWGGEEFAIILPSASLEIAIRLAKRVREQVEDALFEEVGHITISIGVSQYAQGESLKTFINRTDKALYLAKHNGRNRVETIEPDAII